MKNIKFVDDVKNVLDKFGPEILTGLGIIFTGLAIKSAIDVAEEATEVDMEYRADVKELTETYKENPENGTGRYPWGSKDLNKLLKQRKLQKHIEKALVYKWSFIFGFSSAVCMICSTKLSGSKIAAAYALAKLNEDKLKIALEKTKEMFGEDGEKAIKNKIADELMVKNDKPIALTKNPELNQPEVFTDAYTGNWLGGTKEGLEIARQKAISELQKNHVLSHKRWLMILGVPYENLKTMKIDDVGWNVFNPFDFDLEELDVKFNGRNVYRILYKNEATSRYRDMTK